MGGDQTTSIFVSATPANYEEAFGSNRRASGQAHGLVDPVVEVRPATSQVDDVLSEIGERVEERARVDYGVD